MAVSLLSGLSAVASQYDAVLCDVWGVIHNGRSAFVTACEALQKFRAHYQSRPKDAAALIAVGESPRSVNLKDEELAAWTMLASQLLNLDETLNQ